MSVLCCCGMGAQLSQEGAAGDEASVPAAPTMADLIRERKKKGGVAALSTLRRRLAARRARPPDRECSDARYIRSLVSSWRPADVFLLHEQLAAGAQLRDLTAQAELARQPAPALAPPSRREFCDVELVGGGWSEPAHRAMLAARSHYFRELLRRHPGEARVPLEPRLPRATVQAALAAVYEQSCLCNKWDCARSYDDDLDLINVENDECCSCGARCTRPPGGSSLQADMLALLHSGEYADVLLSFGEDEECALPCHRVVLASRSPYFRALFRKLSVGWSAGAPRPLLMDARVFPARFGRAVLHAAYTDQVDLSLIARTADSPSAAGSGWPGVSRGAARPSGHAQMEDAFQLYEIARFLEMPIVAQGCEDALRALLSPATLPRALAWASAPHASRWLYRQAMRYFLDEFPAVMAAGGVGRGALLSALQCSTLQCAEHLVLRAVWRWAHRHHQDQPEPNVVWHTAHSASRRARREGGDGALRDALAPLLAHVRLEHIPPDNEILQQAIKRGLVCRPPPQMLEPGSLCDAWLGRGPHRPPRAYQPYLDELKALLADQPIPEAELARARRQRYLHRIPDTLYMVSERSSPPPGSAAPPWLPPRELRALLRRYRALSNRAHSAEASMQVALRCVRERGLHDAAAGALLADVRRTSGGGGGGGGGGEAAWSEAADSTDHCCRSGVPALRGPSPASEPPPASELGSWRRELPALVADGQPSRWGDNMPDVALPPNGNTHLLTERVYRHAEAAGGILQLDLGDGATHTPRPGSRALRAASQLASRPQVQVTSHARQQLEHRAAIEASGVRAAVEFVSAAAATLPSRRRLPPARDHQHVSRRGSPPGARRRAEPPVLRGADGGSPSHRRHYRAEAATSGAHGSRGPSPRDYA